MDGYELQDSGSGSWRQGVSLLRAAAGHGVRALWEGACLLGVAVLLALFLFARLLWEVSRTAWPGVTFVLRLAVVAALLLLPAALEAVMDFFLNN